ncbi:MAG: Gfo/Idh/MocA family oxidoreductase [Phycisphaerales bacterium]|nr:Gfo/Idh/MocA family oxidoreductase [Phycisphaerales bacterium]
MSERPIRYGMVGGGRDAFIGAVHRMAARLDDAMHLLAGALSSTPEKAKASGEDLGLDPARCYGSWQDMLKAESALPADERIECVVIVTPNHVHHAPAKAALEAGFHVVCDKPLTCTPEDAQDLVDTARATGKVFGVTYNYTGYPMIRHAAHMVRSGAIGSVRKVFVEYLQGWLATPLEESGQKQADWRTDPTRAGAGGAMGDIGSHAENLVSTVTGLKIESFCSDVSTFVPGRSIDDDTSVLLRFAGGARGVLSASQVCVGHRNGLTLRVYGETGAVHWNQERPDQLMVHTLDGPDTVLHRADADLADAATAVTRLPGGHPEAFIEAFANIYRGVAAAIGAGEDDPARFGYPGVADGARGVRFINQVIAAGGDGWTTFEDA